MSGVQGSWGNLRSIVIDNFEFPSSDKLLFYTHEAMSWESVRNIKKMEVTLLLIQNIIEQKEPPKEVIEWLEEVRLSFKVTLEAISEGIPK
ncbi:MAG: hypothetical protein ACI808_001605 [Paraglaciecola sp.]